MKPKWGRVWHFAALTYGVSFLFAGILHITGMGLKSPVGVVFGVVYMFFPALAAFVLMRFVYHEPMKDALGLRATFNPWFLVAWLGPIVLLPLILLVGYAFPGIGYDPGMADFMERLRATVPPENFAEVEAQLSALPVNPVIFQLISATVAGASINAVAAFGEELGWRGFLQRELAPLGFWRSSLLIGVIWGAWHAPFIMMGHNYPHHPYLGIPLMIVFTTLLAPLISYVRLRSRNIYSAAVFHGTLNAFAGFPLILSSGADELLVGYAGLAGFIVLALVNAGMWAFSAKYPQAFLPENDEIDDTELRKVLAHE